MIGDIITDLVCGGGFGLALSGTYALVKRRLSKKPVPPVGPNALGAYPWLWETAEYRKNSGFRCPKCRARKLNHKTVECCTCENYHTEHFHFECKGCKFKCIMRSADDR